MSPDGSALTLVSALLAFSAGFLSVLTPCVIALVPAYIAYMSSKALSKPGWPGTLRLSLMFVLGFSTVFIAMGASATAIGQTLLLNRPLIRQIAGIVVVVLGLYQLGLLRIGMLDVERRLLTHLPGGSGPQGSTSSAHRPGRAITVFHTLVDGPAGPFVVGMAFAAGWSPCVGPVLASILMLAGTTTNVSAGIALLALYSLGMAIPFLVLGGLLGAGASTGGALGWLRRQSPVVEKASGILLILIGIMLFTNLFALLPRYFPSWGAI